MSLNRDNINIPLKCNYKNSIRPTNSLREDEYENSIVIPGLLNGITRNFEIGEFDVTFNLKYHISRFWLSVSIGRYGNDEYIEIGKDKIDNVLLHAIAKRAEKFVEEMNSNNYQCLSFENADGDDYFQIYKGKIYGLIYDLNTNNYVEPPKIVKTAIKFEPVDYNAIIDKFRQ